jgi:DNA-binding transcriptional ArsR family regulator
MSDVYRALSDPTRRTIIRLLRQRDRSAGELADHFPVTKADLIRGRRTGTTIIYSLNVSVLEDALCGLLDVFRITPKSKPTKEES